MIKSDTKKSKLKRIILKSQIKKVDLLLLLLDMIRNKQYPYVHIPTLKTQDGSKIPSHEFLQRMSTPQTSGWFYEQKVIHQENMTVFFNFSFIVFFL